MQLIAEHANPFFLKELYLDGCENICDKALLKLTKPRAKGAYTSPNLENYRLVELLAKEHLSQIAGSDNELRKLVTEISLSGTRSLEVISLSECRQITDNGIVRLGKCKLLRKVCFLGCANFKDTGIIGLASQLPYLEEIDVGSTNITG